MTLEEDIDKLAAQPLLSQPGAAWNYSLSTDVLGRVVEVASGQPFDVFLRDRIFTPLGMTDTDFDVADAKWSRLATVYSPDGAGGIRPMKDPEIVRQHHDVADGVLQGAEEVLLRRRRPHVHGARLRAVRADAARTAARSTACACSSPKTSS